MNARFMTALLQVAGALTLTACAGAFERGEPARPPLSPEAVASAEPLLKQQLEAGMVAFNRGDMATYLADLAPRVRYNGLTVDRARLIEMNVELKQDFPDVSGAYENIRVRGGDAGDLIAFTKAEYRGKTADYQQSGMPATYEETAQLAARYRPQGEGYVAERLTLTFNDATVRVGEAFGVIGPSDLPALAATEQPYTLRLVAGHDQRGARVGYAYGLLPLEALVEKGKGEEALARLERALVPAEGLTLQGRMPKTPGTYAHYLVLTKLVPGAENILGQLVFSRLVRVE